MALRFWSRHRPRWGVAFSDRFVLALRNGEDPKTLTTELPIGALAPSAVTPNIDSVSDVAKWTAELLGALGARPNETVALVLPDLSVTTALFGTSAPGSDRQLRDALRERLPFPETDARCDFWHGRAGEVLAAGVRRAVVAQYESVLEAAACRLGWVDAASLAHLPQWSRELSREGRDAFVLVQLYGSHYFVTAFRSGELFDLRLRLRSPGDVEVVAGELLRLPKLYESALSSLTLSGQDARECAERLTAGSELGKVTTERDSEDAHLVASIRAIIARS